MLELFVIIVHIEPKELYLRILDTKIMNFLIAKLKNFVPSSPQQLFYTRFRVFPGILCGSSDSQCKLLGM